MVTLIALVLFAAGCYDSHLCGTEEVCDYDDNDCDDLIDEEFVDADGVYFTAEHCGGCGVSCADVFPTAAETECVVEGGVAGCRIVSCSLGFHLGGEGACVPDVPVVCLPCNTDADCALREPGAVCVDAIDGGGRCAPPCRMDTETGPCPMGAECVAGFCSPIGGDCTCNAETLGLTIGCIVVRDDGYACAGAEVCEEGGFGGCLPALAETCNEQDDDCDGAIDEDFRDEAGRYVDRLHCGGCATPCVEPGPNMVATCLPDGPVPRVRCDVVCEDGFVDVDGIEANGCECERWDGTGPPPAVGGDSDCDGLPDDTTDFIYVTSTGSDTNPGTLARPVRTLGRAAILGRIERKDVLVARGVYEGPFRMVAGVDFFGGYRPDFRDRDLELYPVLIEARMPGEPAVVCDSVTAATRFEGFTLEAIDATGLGRGATTLYSNECGASVTFAELTVLAGRGADGVRGDNSSDNLRDWGLGMLDELNGVNGANGRDSSDGLCSRINGGPGGRHLCRAVDVSGGSGGAGDCLETGCRNGLPCGNAGCTDFTVGGVCDIAAALRTAVANPAAQAGRGPMPGAAGELSYSAPTNRNVCNFCDDNPTLQRDGGPGGDGALGANGVAGAGCAVPAMLDTSTGRLSGASGGAGRSGTDGSGGGGATAGAGYDVIGGTEGVCSDRSGGAGGGGGSGGCGAPGADGGTGGGTSAGVVVRLRAGVARGPSFDGVRIVTASGGRGGDGGLGASGGPGGVGGLGGGARFWCARTGGRGGDGGRGGAGGGGGGGCGGGSHGVAIVAAGDPAAYVSDLSATVMIDETGVAGRGGRGGFSPGAAGGDGTDGDASPIVVLP